jgi:hypothetical protein
MPLLIGRGVVPIVWLYVPVTKDRMKWKYIVERNVSHSEKVFVKISKELNSVNISIELSEGLQELVSVKMISNEEAVVDKLDLNPIGFKIRGDNNGLHIGEQFFTGNIFEGVYSMVAIGD